MKKIIWKLLFILTTFFFLSKLKAETESVKQIADATAKPMNEVDIVWGDAPPSLPKGAKLALLAGDPCKEGPITLRAIFPPNYKMAAYTHLSVEKRNHFERLIICWNGR